MLPRNTIDYARENNLFAETAYPQQSEQAFAIYDSDVERGKKILNLRYLLPTLEVFGRLGLQVRFL